jgi:hypothetical protein
MIQQILEEKLRGYIEQNNPDLLLQLSKDFSVSSYLENKVAAIESDLEQWIAEGKPKYIIEELSMQALTAGLRPSRFNYVKEILEEDFLQTYESFRRIGVLTYEAINIIEACNPVFEALGFTEADEGNRALHYAIIGAIEEYLHLSAN